MTNVWRRQASESQTPVPRSRQPGAPPHFRSATPAALLLSLLTAVSPPALGQTPDREVTAAYESQLPALRRAAPDVVVGRLRQRATALLSPMPGFDPGARMADLMIERPWAALRRRCAGQNTAAGGTGLGLPEALALVDDMLRNARLTNAGPADRGALAAMLAALDGRLCQCAGQPSLALAADCAS